MPSRDPRIDAYINKAQPFAKPILRQLRTLVHKACPDVEETIKWGFPHFDYLGEMMCSMASFKNHCAFGFWKASLMKDATLVNNARSESAMGHFGKITSINDLPGNKKMVTYIKEAAALNKAGVQLKKMKRSSVTKELSIPEDILLAVKKNSKALQTFLGFSYSSKKEYVVWIVEAKTETTRQKRLETAVKWMAEGKVRNWKYKK